MLCEYSYADSVWLKSMLIWLKYIIFLGDCFYWHTLIGSPYSNLGPVFPQQINLPLI